MGTTLEFVETLHGGEIMFVSTEQGPSVALRELRANIERNVSRGTPRFVDHVDPKKKRSRPLAIVAGGMSVLKTLERARTFNDIMVCGSAHDYVLSQGLAPRWSVLADARQDCITMLQRSITYLVASNCAPELFDALEGFDVQMWHARTDVAGGDQAAEAIVRRGEPQVAWGCTCALAAIYLGRLLGFTDLHLFGVDSCYESETATHPYQTAGEFKQDKFHVDIGGRRMLTDGGMLLQAEYFWRIIEMEGEFFHATIHGDGLIAEMARKGDPKLSQYVSLAA